MYLETTAPSKARIPAAAFCAVTMSFLPSIQTRLPEGYLSATCTHCKVKVEYPPPPTSTLTLQPEPLKQSHGAITCKLVPQELYVVNNRRLIQHQVGTLVDQERGRKVVGLCRAGQRGGVCRNRSKREGVKKSILF